MLNVDTGFDGILIIKPKVYEDDRGKFYETWRELDYQNFGIKEKLLQDNISVSNKNVLRGLHYQKNQGQLITLIYGKIFDVVVDIRPTSKTFKKYYSIELDSIDPIQLYMAPGFAHGFCVLSDHAIINYKCTQYYNPSQEGGIKWDDPEINIKWPKADYIISEKDMNGLYLNKIDL